MGQKAILLILWLFTFKGIYAEDKNSNALASEDKYLPLYALVEENLQRRCIQKDIIGTERQKASDIGMCAFNNPSIQPDTAKNEDGFNVTITYTGICGVYGDKSDDTKYTIGDLGKCGCMEKFADATRAPI